MARRVEATSGSGSLQPTPAGPAADSIELLRTVAQALEADGWRVGNLDVTVVAQRPRLSEHVPTMRERLASALGVSAQDVSVKATTTDHLGTLGRGEGIGAQAVVLLVRRSGA